MASDENGHADDAHVASLFEDLGNLEKDFAVVELDACKSPFTAPRPPSPGQRLR